MTEGLIAKEVGVPLLIVDALEVGEDRAFPYGGNTRTLRWREPISPRESEDLEKFRATGMAEGERVIAAAVREALRQVHAQKRLESYATKGDVVLRVAPEPARIAYEDRSATFLYPDPPVGMNERSLLTRVVPDADFVTPMTRFVRRRQGAPAASLAVSISECEDVHRYGLTMEHVRLISDEVHLYLLLAGLRIVYGGKLDPDKLKVVDDPDNFTLRLFGLVQRYRDLALDAGAEGIEPIVNAAPWPLWKLYDRSVTKTFGRIAKLDRVPLPDDFPIPIEDLEPLENGFVPPAKPMQLYAWARALTHMREKVTDETSARLCIGGKVEGYKGRMAGLIEEPLIQIEKEKPLFLVGALGGCTRLVIELLDGQLADDAAGRRTMTTAVAEREVKHYVELTRLYEQHGGAMPTREVIASKLREAGKNGPAAALRNGLDDDENRLLFHSTDPATIAELVLLGLERLGI